MENLEFKYDVIDEKKITYIETSDEMESFQLQILSSGVCPNILPVEVSELEDYHILKYDITGLLDMKTYFRKVSLKRKNCFSIIRALINVVLESNNYYLDWENFLCKGEKIFLDMNTFDIKLIYIPFKDSEKIRWSFKDFFMNEFLGNVKFDEEENFSFVLSIISLINIYEGTDEKTILRKVLELINREESASVILVEAEDGEKEKDNLYGKLTRFIQFFDIEKLKRNFKKTEKSIEDKKLNEIIPSTVVLKNIKRGYFLTPIAGEYEKIAVSENNLLVGRSRVNVDAFIDNISIGKIHAEIVKDRGSYFIRDINSLNGTFINNIKMESLSLKEIKIGDIVRFADVEYLFELR